MKCNNWLSIQFLQMKDQILADICCSRLEALNHGLKLTNRGMDIRISGLIRIAPLSQSTHDDIECYLWRCRIDIVLCNVKLSLMRLGSNTAM